MFLSLTCNLILLFCTLSPEGEWPLSPLGNSLLFWSELVPIHEWRVYFPWPSHRSIPLKSGQGLAHTSSVLSASWVYAMPHMVAQYVPLASSYNPLLFLRHHHACTCFMHLCIYLISFLNPICMHDFHRYSIYEHMCTPKHNTIIHNISPHKFSVENSAA